MKLSSVSNSEKLPRRGDKSHLFRGQVAVDWVQNLWPCLQDQVGGEPVMSVSIIRTIRFSKRDFYDLSRINQPIVVS